MTLVTSLDRLRREGAVIPRTDEPDRPVLAREPARVHRTTTVVAVLVPTAVTFVLSVAWSGRPSYWLDETATVSAVDRPVPELLAMLRNIDAVHGAFYLLLWPWAQISQTEAWLRFPLALAAAGGTAAVVGVGWQLFARRTALVAGLVYALLPLTSLNGATARSPALWTALVAAATFALCRYANRLRTRWLVAFTVLMAAAVTVFLFAAFVLLAHAAFLVLSRLVSVRSVAAFALPVAAAAVVADRSVGQASISLSAARRPTTAEFPGALGTAWFSGQLVLAVVVGLAAVVGTVLTLRSSRERATGVLLISAALVTPVVLWAASQVHPVLAPRYLQGGAFAVVLLAARGAAQLRRPRLIGLALPLAVLASGLPTQVHQRMSDGHGDDPRAAMRLIRTNERPGDAIAFEAGYSRTADAVYPTGLPDISLARQAVSADWLWGTSATDAVVAERASGYQRVWLVSYGPGTTPPAGDPGILLGAGFTPAASESFGPTEVHLWTR